MDATRIVPSSAFLWLLLGILISLAFVLPTWAEDQRASLAEKVEIEDNDLQVWLRLDELARLFVLEIERASDSIAETAETHAARRSALLLQANAASAMLAASAHPEAKLAFLDSWVLVEQFRRYFGSDEARKTFGEKAMRLEEAAGRIASSFATSAHKMMAAAEAEQTRELVAEWAAREVLESETFLRRSAIDILADELQDRSDGALSVSRRIGRATEAMESRLGLYAEVLPRVFRWQARLAAEAPELRELAGQSVETLEAIQEMLRARSEEEGRILEELEALVERQRRSTLADTRSVLEEVASDTVDRAIELAFRKVLLLAVAGFLAACVLVLLNRWLSRPS